jgi:adenosylcobinamide-GDP ribazoletransferase
MPGASLRAAAAAVSFLTRVPVGRVVAVEGDEVARGAVLFPLVGAGVGAVAGALAAVLHPALPPFLAATVAVGAAVLLTGALHVDALGDVFDAAGVRSRERALEIMRDPRIGAFGATAIAFDLLLKVGSVTVLIDRGGALAAFVAAGALSRAVPAALAAALPGSLIARLGVVPATGAVLLGVGIAVLAAGTTGAILAGAAALVAVAAFALYRAWLGAANGDCLGAATEATETLALVVAAALA